MEPSNAGSWLTDFEMNYSSFFDDFEQLNELISSPMIPGFSSISPECFLSNLSPDQNQNTEVHFDSTPQENGSSVVPTDQAKKKKKLTNKRPHKGKNGTSTDDTNNSNESSRASGDRKRNYDSATAESDREKNSNCSAEQVVQPEYHRKGHVMAERKRREKITKQFIALSSLVPGLTKMDKSSVLGDAIEYLKQLKDKVSALETEAAQSKVQDVLTTKKTVSSPGECNSSTSDGNSPGDELSTKAGSVPKIDVSISELIVLIKIQWESQKGVFVKSLSEIERLGLTITSTSIVPFTDSSFDMTITAKVQKQHSITAEDLVKKLKFALSQF